MKYIAELRSNKNTGKPNIAWFRAKEGCATELYRVIISKLTEFYRSIQFPREIVLPAIGAVERSIDGAHDLGSAKVAISEPEDRNLGNINLKYWRKTFQGRPRQGVDYAASATFSRHDDNIVEGILLYFNTFPPKPLNVDNNTRRARECIAFLEDMVLRDPRLENQTHLENKIKDVKREIYK
jgi:hypothetical protein